MILSGSCVDWEKHQQRELGQFLSRFEDADNSVDRCLPAYPGSMLFNQIAVCQRDTTLADETPGIPRFDSLDAVYESLGIVKVNRMPDNTVLVDCQSWWPGLEDILSVELEALSRDYGEKLSVALLSDSCQHQLKSICDRLSIGYVVVRPRWWNAASLLCLYRGVRHTVFVDTARCLDAAMTGVNCSLIASEAYSRSLVFPVLFDSLRQLVCCRLSRVSAWDEVPVPSKLSIVENSQAALLGTLGLPVANDDVGVVIRTEVFWQQLWKRRIGNMTVSTRRKSRKLVEDPRAFFTDSKLPGSNAIATFLSAPAVPQGTPTGLEKEVLEKEVLERDVTEKKIFESEGIDKVVSGSTVSVSAVSDAENLSGALPAKVLTDDTGVVTADPSVTSRVAEPGAVCKVNNHAA